MNNQPIADALQVVANNAQSDNDFYVKTLTGKSLPLALRAGLTVKQVKEQVAEREQIPVEQQRLIFNGKNLEDDNQLSDYNVQVGSTVHLVLRLRGGF